MKKPEVPDDVRRFVLTSIPSVRYVEALLLMRAEPDRDWNGRRLARRLYSSESQAMDLLGGLSGAGIARKSSEEGNSFIYAPASPELEAMLDRVAHYYSANLVAITDLIHSRMDRRAQQFADAFRWKKDE